MYRRNPDIPERDYRHKDIVEKLGIKTGLRVAFDPHAGPLDALLVTRVLEQAEESLPEVGQQVDVVLATVDGTSDAAALLQRWKRRLASNGGIWLLSAKRGDAAYVDQRILIRAGQTAGLVDNKVCSVSDTISAMRFVIRKQDRLA